MRTILYEDDLWRRFLPLSALRSLHQVRCGILPLWEKHLLRLQGGVDALSCRPQLAPIWISDRPSLPINPSGLAPTRWLSTRVFWDHDRLEAVTALKLGEALADEQGVLLGAVADLDAAEPDLPDRLKESVRIIRIVDFPQLRTWYDLLDACPDEIVRDAELLQLGPSSTPVKMVQVMGEPKVWLGDGVTVGPAVCLDTREGPVIVDDGATLMPGVFIEGPCYVGKGSLVRAHAALLEGCSIGKRCKVGGELSAVLMQGYANKQHEGYLGHAVVGAWVNLGASTSNSDLKNTYGTIITTVDGEPINTGRTFLGCCLGDHVKTGINSMLNTGTVVGVAGNLFGTGFHPQSIPDFIWGQPGNYKEYLLDRVVATARTVMGRRHVEMSPAYEALLRGWFEETRPRRERFLSRRTHRTATPTP
jgi:UDP-N-acetylglucosamine diphosphorylase / glucose-1-phosphate thymidylyltransferase / UDP-N-acetylgalactosamine diphosphorylase / glucosamine-1-phosphate N-acetyltransferase / galactosamine-1-phosphate N-acetyltransferase